MVYSSWNFATKALLCGLLLSEGPAFARHCSRTSRCGRLALAAQHAYRMEDYQSALRGFQDAYALSHTPVLLLNIGCAQYELYRYADAKATFLKFLRSYPNSPYGQSAEEYVGKTLERLRAPASFPTGKLAIVPTVPTQPEPLPEPASKNFLEPMTLRPIAVKRLPSVSDTETSARSRSLFITTGSVSAIVGAIGVIAGAGCYGALASLQQQFRRSADEFSKQSMLEQAGHLSRASTASYVVGGVLLGAGVSSLGIVGYKDYLHRKAARSEIKLSGVIGPETLGVSLEGRWP